MTELEAWVYVICSIAFSWGLRGFKIVQINKQEKGASYNTNNSEVSSGGTKGINLELGKDR